MISEQARTTTQFRGRSCKKKQEQGQTKDPFQELTQWISQMKRPIKNQVYTLSEILLLKNYLEIVEGIQLTKKSFQNTLTFRCKNISQCSFQVKFQQCQYLKVYKKDPYFKLIRLPRSHSTIDYPNCYLDEQQNLLNQRKVYLNLIHTSIKQIIVSEQCAVEEKNPTWVLKKLHQQKNQPKDFLFEGLLDQYRRQLKKSFDNTVRNIKNQIKQEVGQNLAKKEQKKHTKTKKVKKLPKKIKIQLQSENQVDIQCHYLDEIFVQNSQKIPFVKDQFSQIKMIDQQISEQKSPNVFEKCFKEAKATEVFHENQQKFKIQENIYLTPNKKVKKYGFDLQKSAQKHQSTYQRSYQHSFLIEGLDNHQKMRSDYEQSDQISQWTPQKALGKDSKQVEPGDFSLQSKISVSDNEQKDAKGQLLVDCSHLKEEDSQ